LITGNEKKQEITEVNPRMATTKKSTQKQQPKTHTTTSAPKSSASKPSQSKTAMDRFKTEVASELGVNLKNGANLTSREAGSIGGEMVRRMIKKQSEQMK
jgi:protein required for attachment to host cells